MALVNNFMSWGHLDYLDLHNTNFLSSRHRYQGQSVLAVSKDLETAKRAGLRLECSYWNTKKNAVQLPQLDAYLLPKRAQETRRAPGFAEEFWRLVENDPSEENENDQRTTEWNDGAQPPPYNGPVVQFSSKISTIQSARFKERLIALVNFFRSDDFMRCEEKVIETGCEGRAGANPTVNSPPSKLLTNFPLGNLPFELVSNVIGHMSLPTALALVSADGHFSETFKHAKNPSKGRAVSEVAQSAIGWMRLLQKDLPETALCYSCRRFHPSSSTASCLATVCHRDHIITSGETPSTRPSKWDTVTPPCMWFQNVLFKADNPGHFPCSWHRNIGSDSYTELYQAISLQLERLFFGPSYGIAPAHNASSPRGMAGFGRPIDFKKKLEILINENPDTTSGEREGPHAAVVTLQEQFEFFTVDGCSRRRQLRSMLYSDAILCPHAALWMPRQQFGNNEEKVGPITLADVHHCCTVEWKVEGWKESGRNWRGCKGQMGMRWEVTARESVGTMEDLDKTVVKWALKDDWPGEADSDVPFQWLKELLYLPKQCGGEYVREDHM